MTKHLPLLLTDRDYILQDTRGSRRAPNHAKDREIAKRRIKRARRRLDRALANSEG